MGRSEDGTWVNVAAGCAGEDPVKILIMYWWVIGRKYLLGSSSLGPG